MKLVLLKSLPVPPRHWRLAMVIGLIAFTPWPIFSANGQGLASISVSPKRIVVEGRARTAEVLLLNRGTVDTTYRIFFTNMRMNENGGYEEITEPKPGELFADGLIRYSPRQVTLPAQGSQSVRLLVRKPRDLPAGEYRSHLVFRSLPPANLGENVEALDLDPGEIKVRMVATFAVSIPIIVRHGDLSASVELSGLKLDRTGKPGAAPILGLHLDRVGDRSVYGDVVVTHVAGDGVETEVGRTLGIAVYTPNQSRTLRLQLSPPDGLEMNQGMLRVVFRENPQEGGEELAEAELALP